MDHDASQELNADGDSQGDVFDDDDPEAPNLEPEAGPSSRVLPGGIELRELIGEGGMGQVFLGFHMRLECDVAVKVLDPGLQLREDSQERLLREGSVLANIRHDNIVEVHHCGVTDDGKVFVVMELLAGETLRQLCRRLGTLDALAVVRIGVQICRALERAHEAGVIHRDITPSNVMILHDPVGRVKVIDFGICRVLDAFLARHQQRFARPPGSRMATPMGIQLGNPEYMAPELLVREPFVRPNVRTDVFSVAVVLFEALTGVHPFRRGDRKKARTVREVRPEFEYVELEEALDHALRSDPESRTPTMAALRDELELAHDCILAQCGDKAEDGAKLLRLDSFRPAPLAAEPEPGAKFLELVRDDEPVAPEPTVARVVLLRPAEQACPPVAEAEEPKYEPPAKAAAVVAVAALPSPDLAVTSKATAPGWFAMHMSGLLLGAGIVSGVGVTLASQQIGASIFTTPARVAELEEAVDVCEQTLEDTRASLVQVQGELGVTRELVRNQVHSPSVASATANLNEVEESPPKAAEGASGSPAPPSTVSSVKSSGARQRSIRRSLDKVLAAVQKCEDDAGGGRLSTLRARIRVEPSGEVSKVELTEGASLAVCVTGAIRSRRYQAGDAAEWIRHDFVFDSKEAP